MKKLEMVMKLICVMCMSLCFAGTAFAAGSMNWQVSQDEGTGRDSSFNEKTSERETPSEPTYEPSLPSLPERGNAGYGQNCVYTTGKVYMRTGPGKEYESVGVIEKNVYAEYLNMQQYDERPVLWYKVCCNGKEGWVSSKYAKLADSGYNASSESIYGESVVIMGGNANYRTGPGLDYSIVGSMREGRVVEYLGSTKTDARGVDWHYIRFEGKEGWVSSRYGKLNSYEN